MKQAFVALAMIGLVSCQTEDKVHIMGTQHDFTQGTKFVPDSVFLNNQAYIDSLTTVTELLDHLETLPAE